MNELLNILCAYANNGDDLPPDITSRVIEEIGYLSYDLQTERADHARVVAERDEAREWARRMKAERDSLDRKAHGFMINNLSMLNETADLVKTVAILRDQLKQMTGERDWYYAAYNNRIKDCEKMKSENVKLFEALEFYAHGRHWEGWQVRDEINDCSEWYCPIDDDGGKTAREALGWQTPEPPEVTC